MTLAYTQDMVNYDHLIGVDVRGKNFVLLGTIVSIEYYVDRYHHHNAVAILNSGKRICCRRFSGNK
jgi:hypothetical protein